MASLRESHRKKYYLQILNYENFNNNLKASFFWRWQSGWKLCLKINAIRHLNF